MHPDTTTLNADAIAGVSDPRLQRILHDHWEDAMARSPTWATQLGDRRFDGQLGDTSTRAIRNHYDARRLFLERIHQLDPTTLPPQDALTRAVFEANLQADLALEPCQFELWNVTSSRNAVADHVRVIADHPLQQSTDFGSLASRIKQMPPAVEAEMQRLEEGLRLGLTADAEAVRRAVAFIDRTLDAPLAESPLFAPGRDPIEGIEASDLKRLHLEHGAQVRAVLLPSLQAYRRFLHERILPAARTPDQATLTGLPGLPECYASVIRRHTTLSKTPEEIHAIGMTEIASVHAEFLALADRMFGAEQPELATDLSALFAHLRSSPDLRFDTPESILAVAEESLRAAEAAVPAVFHTLPSTPCEVRPIPANVAPFTYVAWYEPPAVNKPGIYRVNTHAPETRLRHEARALAFHESVPGHHLQIAYATELSETPAFRRHGGITAYVEGWALYSERLADELSLYPSDLDRLGMLSFDAWRSARLVVDTGLHHYGWTREEAEAWMQANTPLAANNIANEVDRYIGWPGQALGYKLGQLEVLRLRSHAQTTLGEAFALADFHSVVLDSGPVPLTVLADRVEAWVAQGGGPPEPPKAVATPTP